MVGYNSPEFDAEGRYVELRFDAIEKDVDRERLFPSGSSGEERQQAKFRFRPSSTPSVTTEGTARVHLVRRREHCPPEHRPEELAQQPENSGFLPEERAWMTKLLDTSGEGGGLVDVYRQLQPATTDTAYMVEQPGPGVCQQRGLAAGLPLGHTRHGGTGAHRVHLQGREFSDHAPITVEYEFAL